MAGALSAPAEVDGQQSRHDDARRVETEGALLGHLYAGSVHRSLDAYQATQWLKSFASPDLLVDRAEQAALIERLVSAGQSSDMMMRSAREALVASIHIGLVVADTAGKWPMMEDTTADFVYVRLHGDEELYVSGYTEAALLAWAGLQVRLRTHGPASIPM